MMRVCIAVALIIGASSIASAQNEPFPFISQGNGQHTAAIITSNGEVSIDWDVTEKAAALGDSLAKVMIAIRDKTYEDVTKKTGAQ